MSDPSHGIEGSTHARGITPPAEQVAGGPPGPDRIEFDSVTKHFGKVKAVTDVSFAVRPGEIRGLLGENGAGKSTLMGVASGVHRPDSGRLLIDGVVQHLHGPRSAIDQGISMVHQHFALVPTMTVIENIALEVSPKRRVFVAFDALRAQLADLLDHHGLEIDLDARVEDLSIGQAQRVELIRALYRGGHVLILDEPTSLLTFQETESLFGVMRSLAAEGKSIVFITHKLSEVLAVSDRISVLRRGHLVETVETADADAPTLSRLMVGDRALARVVEPAGPDTVGRAERVGSTDAAAPPVLRVEQLRTHGHDKQNLAGLSFEVRPGEVYGIAGVEGNGQEVLAETLVGLGAGFDGVVQVCGVDIAGMRHRQVVDLGLGFISEDRQHASLAMTLSVQENLFLRPQSRAAVSNRGVLRKSRLRETARELMDKFDVLAASPEAPVRSLSGGNQQKVVLARELSGDPKVLIAAQPTRGLDFSAQQYVYETLEAKRRQGAAILIISTDLDEIFAVCTRLAVLYEGELMGEIPVEAASEELLGLMMGGLRLADIRREESAMEGTS